LIGGLALASHKVIRSTEGLIGLKLQGFVTDNGPPFAADGGIPHVSVVTSRDPFEALDDLVTVIEALC
jgi:hypothetical protein